MGYQHLLFSLLLMAVLAPSCRSKAVENIPKLLRMIISNQQTLFTKIEEQSKAISGSREQMTDFLTMLSTDECKNGSHRCSEFATCVNRVIYNECSCMEGYSGDGFTCLDIDECSDIASSCGEGVTCINTPGSFQCTCEEGFKFENKTCQDIDECALDIHSCDRHATCTNNAGNYTCECGHRYTGDGRVCEVSGCKWPFSFHEGVGCIYLMMVETTWEEAKSNCHSLGSDLYEPESNEEFLLLAKYFMEASDYDFIWVGAKGGKWMTSGQTIDSALWTSGEPNQGSNAVVYMRRPTSYKLADINDSHTFWSLCKVL